MERRLLTFIVASTAFFLFYFSLRVMFVPPRPPQAAKQADRPAGRSGGRAVSIREAEARTRTQRHKVERWRASRQSSRSRRGTNPPPSGPNRPQWVTLGSMDPESGYFLLVTFNSRGGGVERIELTERDERGGLKYRRVDVRHGYLGYLAGEAASDANGVLVNVVGPGTPAAIAGVQVGDVIVALAGKPVLTRDDLDAALINSRDGDTVSIEVLRGGDDAPLVLSAKLTNHPLDLVRLARDGGDDQVAGNLSELSCLVTLSQVNRKAILPGERSISEAVNPSEMIWSLEGEPTDDQASANFTLELSAAEMQPIGGSPHSTAAKLLAGPIVLHRRHVGSDRQS